MNVLEFSAQYPQYRFDFSQPISLQARIFDPAILESLPEELEPSHEYRGGGRGRPNLNQTLAHSQCKTCKRVLRNNLFYNPPSHTRRNTVYTHCLTCTQIHNADRYTANASTTRIRRNLIWHYLAPRCQICGFDQHASAMDMHHIGVHSGAKEAEIAELITEVTLVPDAYKAEKLLREASSCVALCSNCHRMLHADVLQLPAQIKPLPYQLTELMARLKAAHKDDRHVSAR